MKEPLEPPSGGGREETPFPFAGSKFSSATGLSQGCPGEGTRPRLTSCPSSQVHGRARRTRDPAPCVLRRARRLGGRLPRHGRKRSGCVSAPGAPASPSPARRLFGGAPPGIAPRGSPVARSAPRTSSAPLGALLVAPPCGPRAAGPAEGARGLPAFFPSFPPGARPRPPPPLRLPSVPGVPRGSLGYGSPHPPLQCDSLEDGQVAFSPTTAFPQRRRGAKRPSWNPASGQGTPPRRRA